MCGIAGVFYADGRKEFAEKWLDETLVHQHHRGPDHTGKYISKYNNLLLGHNRLSIVDLSNSANQPMQYQNCVMVFNGEIYNHRTFEDFSYLNDDYAIMKRSGDTKNLMISFANRGYDNTLRRANGMYAIAMHPIDMNTIVLSVDPTGQKPIYYYQSEDEFYFASTPASLYNIKDKWEIDYEALETYWQFGAVIGENQIMKGIKKVTSGQTIIYDHRTKSIKTEYLPFFQPVNASVDGMKFIIERNIDAVKDADVPVSIFLSGGIDSTLVASRFANTNTTAIHLNSPETKYAEFVAKKFGLNLHVVNPKNYSMDEILTDYVTKSGEPTMAGPIPWIVAKEAREFAKVAIIANGADE